MTFHIYGFLHQHRGDCLQMADEAEKRGMLVRVAGGAAARAVTPVSLFGLNILARRWAGSDLVFAKK